MTERQKILDLVHRLAAQTVTYPYKVWGYGEAVGLEGLLVAASVTGESAYFEFVHGLIDAWVGVKPHIDYPDHVAPGLALLEVYQRTGDERLLEQARRLAGFFERLPRTPSGAALHRPDHPEFAPYVYVDCMQVDAPFLCRLAQITGESWYFDVATDLLLGHIEVLQDSDSGLFYHLYDSARQKTNGAFWARGNGWAILGLVSVLEALPDDHPDAPRIRTAFERLAAALIRLQDRSGHWHTVLDYSDASLETSAAAFFCAALIRGVRSCLLPASYLEVGERAWQAVASSINSRGILTGVSQATPPGSVEDYLRVPTGGLYPWGQGPALLAAAVQLSVS